MSLGEKATMVESLGRKCTGEKKHDMKKREEEKVAALLSVAPPLYPLFFVYGGIV